MLNPEPDGADPEVTRLRRVFEAALEQPPEDRRAWLGETCRGDAHLVGQVERMLAADCTPHHLLDVVAAGDWPELTCPSAWPTRTAIDVTQGQRAGRRREYLATTPLFSGGEVLAARFRIVALRGRGGMGEVYVAEDLELGQPVALKFLTGVRSPQRRARLRTEVRLARQIAHPNVCRVYDIGEAGGHLYLSMEYVDGEDLGTILERTGRVAMERAVGIAGQICAGLDAAHAKGILHRDLKPANIMIDAAGDVRIMDFGLASLAAEPVDDAHRRSGTPAYMAPEQLAGADASAGSDIYALGLILFELFTGVAAFPERTASELFQSRQRGPATAPSCLVPGLNRQIERTILRCLRPEPGERPAGSVAVAASLAISDGPAAGRSTAPAIRRVSQSPYSALLAAAIVASLSIFAVGRQSARTPIPGLAALADVDVQPLTLDGMAALGTISPDGRLLVYQPYEQLAVNVRRISDGVEYPLVPPGRFARISSVTVAPGNDFVDVVATTGDAANPDLWRIPLAGGEPARLLRNVVSAVGWSPDGRQMAYLRTDAASGGVTLVVATADGSNPRELVTFRPPRMFFSDLTAGAGRPPSRPAWSPDGRSLVLGTYTEGTLGNSSELVTIDVRTGRERRSERLPGAWSEVAWLDEHRYLLIGGDHPLGFPAKRVWVSDVTGRQRTSLTREFGFFMNLSVTADRTTALAKRFSRLSGIWVSDSSGQNEEIKVPLSLAAAAHPKIDLAGGLTYTAMKPDGASALYYLARGATAPVQLVDSAPPPMAVPFHDVSADGRTIVYKQLEEPQGLFCVQNDGTGRRRLVDGDVAIPRLTPDGRTALFTRNTAPGLYRVSLAGGAVQQVTSRVIPDGRVDRRFGPGFSLSPNGRQLLMETGTPGILVLCQLSDCAEPIELALPSLRWGPHGTGVTYLHGAIIMEQPLGGGPPRAAARTEGRDRIIDWSWSPDGSRVATARGWYPNDMVVIKALR